MRQMTERNPEAGFTLIEALVALSVISVGAVALISALETTLQRTYNIEVARAAGWVADAELTKLELVPSATPSQVSELYGTTFSARATVSSVPESNLEKITLEVYAPSAQMGGSNILARQVGFRRTITAGR